MTAHAQPSASARHLKSLEFRFLFVIFAAVSATFAVVLSLGLFRTGATSRFDEALILAFRNPKDLSDAIGPHWVEEMGRDFTALGGFPVLTLLTLAIAGFLMFRRLRATAGVIVGSTFLALLLSSGLKSAFDRTRPDLVPHGQHVYTASFPSGHSMHSAATYLTLGSLLALFQRRRRLKLFIMSAALTVMLLVGWSRVYLGVHWPTDVLGGWAMGTLCAMVALLVARRLLNLSDVTDEVRVADDSKNGGAVNEPA